MRADQLQEVVRAEDAPGNSVARGSGCVEVDVSHVLLHATNCVAKDYHDDVGSFLYIPSAAEDCAKAGTGPA